METVTPWWDSIGPPRRVGDLVLSTPWFSITRSLCERPDVAQHSSTRWLVLRRDVVHAVMEYLKGVDDVQQRVLYLSALREAGETPYFD